MKIVIACDSFKGSLSSARAAEVIARGVREVFPEAEIKTFQIADGGEGTVEAVVLGAGGLLHTAQVLDPLGRPITARYGTLPDGTAVIEMAAASGITLVSEGEKDPRVTSTYGTGQLIEAALDRGCRRFILGIGGSATNDGGAGMAQALGAELYDEQFMELGPGGAELARLRGMSLEFLDERIRESEFTVACDVTNPLCGPKGASAVFGPQKGADENCVRELDAALENYAAVLEKATGRAVKDLPGAGAAGGLGAGLMALCGAVMRPGIELVLEYCGIEAALEGADLVITGEGRLDASSAFGKAPVGVAEAAARHGVPVAALGAQLGDGYRALFEAGIGAAGASVCSVMSLEEAIEKTEDLLQDAAFRLMKTIKIGMEMQK